MGKTIQIEVPEWVDEMFIVEVVKKVGGCRGPKKKDRRENSQEAQVGRKRLRRL